MQELIHITTDGQGSLVVSARELHGFLQVRSKFADWIKNRIMKYEFREFEDYIVVEGFSKSLEKPRLSKLSKTENNIGGRPEMDYALTLDMAKQLTMVENNAKGKQARQYFIECEKRLRATALPPATSQHLLAMLTDQQEQLQELQGDLDRLINHRGARSISMDVAIIRLMNRYCQRNRITHKQLEDQLRKRLRQVYGITVEQMQGADPDTLYGAVERYGCAGQLYLLLRSEFATEYVPSRIALGELRQITATMYLTGIW